MDVEERIELWPSGAPEGWAIEGPETRRRAEDKTLHVSNVAIPRLERWGEGDPVLIVPGGGYWIVATEHEGEEVARFLADHGMAGWVLTYRLPRPEVDTPRWRVPVEDVLRAAEILQKQHAERPLAAIGFSAGAHAVAVAAAQEEHFARVALIYPGYMTPDDRPTEVSDEISPTHAVPTFVAISEDDFCGAHRARVYVDAVRKTGAETEEHYPATGGHGYGLKPHGENAPWLPDLVRFLKAEGHGAL